MKNAILIFNFLSICILGNTKAFSQITSPTGVTCPTNDASYVFIAEFDDFDGWTGDLTSSNNGGLWEIPGSSTDTDTSPNVAFSGSGYMHYESSGADWLLSAAAVTPSIDLSTASNSAELSFYMHAFGEGMGTLNVGISTSITDPFTNLFTWTGELQTSGSDPWVAVGINLDNYLGQIIYLEFNQTRTDNFRGDMSIDLVRVETCGTFCLSPTVSIDGISSNEFGGSVDVSWVANDSEASWEYVVQESGTGIPTSGTTSVVTNFTEDALLFDTDYEVYVRANCTNGNSTWAGPVNFTTPTQTEYVIDCDAGGPIIIDYCYSNGGQINPEIFTFTSSDGSPVNLNFQSGFVWNNYDGLVIINTDGSYIIAPEDNFYGDEGNLSGLSYTSSGDTIAFYINSLPNSINNCEDGYAPMNNGITYSVSCATCINPEFTYNVVDDCDNGNQFLVDVNVTSLGDAASLTLSNNINTNTLSINTIGTYQIGPFPFFIDVIFTLSSNQNINCVVNSSPLTLLNCLPDNDDCEDATIAIVNQSIDCIEWTSGTLLSAQPSNIPEGSCTGDPNDDVWYEFSALSETQIITIQNIAGSGRYGAINLDQLLINHALYEGSCESLVELYCTDTSSSVTPQLVVGNSYYLRVFSESLFDTDLTYDLCIKENINNIVVTETDDTYSVEELVQNLLFEDYCVQVSNITFSNSNEYGNNSPGSIGSFTMDGPGFPFSEGLILSNGYLDGAPGPNTLFSENDGSWVWPGDLQLDNTLGMVSRNASIIEFDFIPLAQSISFDYIFASNQYTGGGNYACRFPDIFACFLTNPNGDVTNIAVLPDTTTTITTENINPDPEFICLFGDEYTCCPGSNQEYFAEYLYADLPPISYNGRSVVLTAQSPVVPGQTYHIKLVIADDDNVQVDSAVFIQAASFDLGELSLGDDITIEAGTATCLNEPVILNTQASGLEHYWFKDGIIISEETSSIITISEPGVYTTQIIFSDQCIISDEITIEFLETPIANSTIDLLECSATNQAFFDLTENDAYILGDQIASEYTITYHLNEQDAIANSDPLPSVYGNVSYPQIIYARIESNTSDCFATTSFFILLSNPSHVAESVDLFGCDDDDDGIANFDLESHNTDILNGQDETEFLVSYYMSEEDAIVATGALPDLYDSSGETLYVRVESVDFADCFVTNSFNLIIGVEPITSFSSDVEYEICPNTSSPFIIDAISENYSLSEVSVYWYRDGGIILDENTLSLPVLEEGLYEVEVVFNDTGCFSFSEVEVTVSGNCVFPQGISPNNDGMNDTFDLSSFNVTKLEIFNRNGTLVYSRNNYTDQWYGQTNDGKELPVGTYFYTVIYEGGNKSKSGWVYLNR